MTAPAPDSGRDAAMFALLVAVSLVFFGPYVAGRFPVSTDISLFHTPNYSLRYDAGVPLWNPYQGCGMPMDRDMQFAAFYPPRLLFFFMPWQSWLGPFLLLHHLIALTGMALLLRALGLSRAAACGGAIAFACGGFYTACIITTTVMQALSWLPWLLLGAVERRPRGGVSAAGGIAMMLLVGSPHLILYGSLAFGFAMLLVAPPLRGGMPVRMWLMRWAQFTAGVGVGLINLIPGLMQVSDSMRTATDAALNLRNSLHPREILTSLLGGAGGVIYPEINDKCIYVGGAGIAALTAAALAPAVRRSHAARLGLALTVAGFALAMGEYAGWQHVFPHLPGFRHLAGPARALLLTATGFGILIAFGIDSLTALSLRRTMILVALLLFGTVCVTFRFRAEVPWPLADVAVRAWRTEPGWLVGGAWPGFNTTLALAPVLLLLALRAGQTTRRSFAPLLAALLLFQLMMFAPRVAPRTVPSDYFDPPPNVRHLMELAREEPPFRVAGIDPLQYSDTAWDSVHKVRFLLPNLSALYGIENIAIYNPLLERGYVELFRATSGQAAFNDPFRKLDPARPDHALYQTLNVRYQIGHPMDRRLTNLPQSVSPSAPVSEVTSWAARDARDADLPVAAWHFVSFANGLRPPPPGTVVATLEVGTPDGIMSRPVRFGIETGWLFDDAPRENPLEPPVVNMTWSGFFGGTEDTLRNGMKNYRGSVRFDPPVRVLSARWRLADPSLQFVIPAQAWRVHDPAEEARWSLVRDDPVAPLFEYADARPRAEWIGGSGERAEVRPAGRGMTRRVYVTESREEGALLLRENASPGWRARVDGREVPVGEADGILMRVPVPSGRHEVVFDYRPRTRVPLLPVSILAAGLCAGLFLAERRLSPRQAAAEDAATPSPEPS